MFEEHVCVRKHEIVWNKDQQTSNTLLLTQRWPQRRGRQIANIRKTKNT